MSKLYLVGNSHIDPVWLWRWQEGFSEILATYRSALDRLKEFPTLKFTSACAVYYELIEKLDPAMFAEIAARVAEGRWCVTGGWLLQPDCNIPDGESYARHALISQRYFKEKLGVIAKTGYNVDSFGHNAALPKILRASGMENYVFMRPMPHEQGRDEYLFRWESDDGSAVTAHRIPLRYNCEAEEHILAASEVAEKAGATLMTFLGIGNHGGGPTIELLDKTNALPNEKVYVTPDEYFDIVKDTPLPTYRGELQHHARGCYSAESTVKRMNRACEQNLLAAERLCLMAKKLTGYAYPAKKLRKAWKNLLFNQFHDILGGCSIKSAYKDASYLFGETMSVTEQEIYYAMQSIAWHIDTVGDTLLPSYVRKNFRTWESDILGVPVTVFNPHTFRVRALVTVTETASRVTDAEGRDVLFQRVRGEQTEHADKYATAFLCDLPPFGYATYRLYTKKAPEKPLPNTLTVTKRSIENECLTVEFDPKTGDICRLYDKKLKKYTVDGKCAAVLLDESDCDTWAHDKTYLGKTVGAFRGVSLSVVESGPARAVVRSVARYKNSTLTRDFTVLAGDCRVTVRSRIDFHEKHRTLKLSFPMQNETVTAKIPYGTVTRTGYTGEEPCGSFIASGDLAVANDGKYGYDTENGQMRLTVLRGAIYADHFGERDGECTYMDMGESEFSYALFAHESVSETEKRASELNFAPRYIMGSFHKGVLPLSQSFFETDDDGILVAAIKEAEDGSGAILRVYEAEGRDTAATVSLFGKDITVSLPHNALKTYTESGEETSLLETPLSDD